jgi:hypothetical protein
MEKGLSRPVNPFEELKTSRRTATPAALFFFDLPQARYARIA